MPRGPVLSMPAAGQGARGVPCRTPRPAVIAETGSFAVVYKPPFMHSAPLKRAGEPSLPETGGPIAGGSADSGKAPGSAAVSEIAGQGTLLDWYACLCPPVRLIRGRQAREGGLLHRLDYETDGLVVFAKTQAAFDSLCAQQEAGGFAKEYIALAAPSLAAPVSPAAGRPPNPAALTPISPPRPCLRGFPPPPSVGFEMGSVIESAFRPFGPGRKAVRPCLRPFPKDKDIALDHGGYYRTEILAASSLNDKTLVRARLVRGFRHQIRCHLAWLGRPLAGDALYGGARADAASVASAEVGEAGATGNGTVPAGGGFFLRACALSFHDPDTQEPARFEISEPPFYAGGSSGGIVMPIAPTTSAAK